MANVRRFYLKLITSGPDGFLSWTVFLLLYPFSLLYSFVMWCRSKVYSLGLKGSYQASVPVVSVGNMTAGGTGKTPVVDALVKYYLAQDCKVAVVSRGYKGDFQQNVLRVTNEQTPEVVGDEPLLLARRNPNARVYVSPKRRYGVMAAEKDGADCIVLDDGFQHLAVRRDLDIVLLDERSPFGNGTVIPSGYLRESKAALKRAGLVVQTHSKFSDNSVVPGYDIVKCRHRFADYLVDVNGLEVPWSQLRGKRCAAFAGIAHPEGFFSQLREAGCDLQSTLVFSDHQDYSPEVLQKIDQAAGTVDYLLTTEKDFVKLSGVKFAKPCLAVPLKLEFDDFGKVSQPLDRVLGGRDA
jgi:tetraacyldisaccharide 4'-kinase